MEAQTDNLSLQALPAVVAEALRPFATAVIERLGGKLQSISVVGSALTEDFVPGRSDINCVLVLDQDPLAAIDVLVSMTKLMKRGRLAPPLLMTPEYIERSRDVFGIELLDFQLTHRTIYGPDPFVELPFEKHHVRLQCERELKATLIRLRQGYVASGGNRRLIQDLLVATTKTLGPLLRAVLWLKNLDRPQQNQPTFTQAGKELDLDSGALITVAGWRYRKIRLSQQQIRSAFDATYSFVEKLAELVDKLTP